jgi:hypothetical protein
MAVDIDIDTHTGQRVAPVLALVQEQVPAADEAYVLKGAVGVGLNFLLDPVYAFVAADFETPGDADDTVSVTLADGDAARAESLATALEVDVGLIYSAALCTGLARLQGSTARITGPFRS